MSSGVVTSEVTPEWAGSALAVDVGPTETVLIVKDAADFAEDFTIPRFVVIGEDQTPRQYVAVQNDEDEGPESITLAAPYGFAVEAGLPIIAYDPDAKAPDKRGIEYWTNVLLDGQPEGTSPIPVVVDHLSIPVSDFDSLFGARVELAEDESEEDKWLVSRILGRAPILDSGVISTPRATGLLLADQQWPSSFDWETVKGFARFYSSAITYDTNTGIWTFQEAGIYLVVLNATFEGNASGNRGIRSRIHTPEIGLSNVGTTTKAVPVDGDMPIQVTELRGFEAGQGISMEVRQTSGGALALLSSSGSLDVQPTRLTIARVATL